jgi:isopenicillin N synthase-like dioxygenase
LAIVGLNLLIRITKFNMAAPPLPIIDITPYLPTSLERTDSDVPATAAARLAVARALHSACRDVGFFYLDVSSFLSREEMDEVLQVGREFFARPQDEKEMIRLENSDGVRGERTHELTD